MSETHTAFEPRQARRSRFQGYSGLYGALAVVALTLSFTPLFRLAPSDPTTYSLWLEIADPNGGVAVLGVIVLLVLVALAVVAVFRPESRGLGFAIAVLAAVIALMVATHPGFGDDVRLSYFGVACVVVAACAAVLGVVHGVHTVVTDDSRRR